MHVISLRALRDFWLEYPRATGPLRSWYKTTKKAEWENFAEVKAVYAAADQVGPYTIFDIGGNKWRLITAIHYNRKKVFVRHVFTHAQYDRWKAG